MQGEGHIAAGAARGTFGTEWTTDDRQPLIPEETDPMEYKNEKELRRDLKIAEQKLQALVDERAKLFARVRSGENDDERRRLRRRLVWRG